MNLSRSSSVASRIRLWKCVFSATRPATSEGCSPRIRLMLSRASAISSSLIPLAASRAA